MRPPILLLASLLLPASPVFAQVTIDLRALDQLPGARSAAPRGNQPAARPAGRASGAAASSPAALAASRAGPVAGGTAQRGAGSPNTVLAPSPPDATLPTGAPPPPSTLQASAAPTPDATPAAMTAAAVRVSFAAAKADLGAEGTEVIRQLVQGAPTGDNTTYNVVAFAAATPDDPSAARRLSLSRALAVRSALMADGVPSTRIYVRALGAQGGDGPADRADVSVLGSNAGPGRQ